MKLLRKNYYKATEVVSIQLFSLTVASKQTNKKTKKKKKKNAEYHDTFISFKNHLYSNQGSPIFLLFGSWSVRFRQIFSDNSNLVILVDIQRLHENGKWILCVSNGVYILLKRCFLAAPHCFIKLFNLQQSSGILDFLWWNNSSNA